MKTFEEYQALAVNVPPSLRNNRDRINLSVSGLQEEAGKTGSLFGAAFASGKLSMTPEQRTELQNRFSNILWCVAFFCSETGISLQDGAAHSIAQLQERARTLDPDRR